MAGPISGLITLATDRADSWMNALTGLGNALRDKLASTQFMGNAHLSEEQLEALYHDDDMAARICEALPEEALRKGYFLNVENDEESDLPSKAREYERRLGFGSALLDGAVWGRVFGGAVVYLGIDDGQAEDKPVNEAAIKSIRWATVLTRRDLQPVEWYGDPTKDVKFGEPKLYEISSVPVTPTGVTGEGPRGLIGVRIHESRLLRFEGTRTSLRRRIANKGWSDSVLQKCHETLMQFGVNWQGVAHLMQDAAQGVFKIDGLIDMIASGDKDTMQRRMELVEMSRSVARALVLDAEREDFHREEYSFSGVPDVLRSFMLRLAAAARMPVTVLMGQSPAGLNATGENDTRLWYDSVQAYQTHSLAPQVSRFYELMFAAQDFEGERPDEWEIRFESLWQMTPLEQATLEKTVADKDKILIDSGMALAEELTLNRFKARGFSQETQLDLDARREMLKAEIELAKSKAGEEPGPPPPPGGNPDAATASDPTADGAPGAGQGGGCPPAPPARTPPARGNGRKA